MIYTLDHNSETALVMIKCYISNKRAYFSLSFDSSVIVIRFGLRFKKIKINFFHFYFFNIDISFNIEVTDLQF